MKKWIWLCLILAALPSAAMDLRLEVNLKGEWRFEIGDNPQYANSGYDDSEWETVFVPSLWENQGFPGYDGYAWYRIKFRIPKSLKGKQLYISLGRIDDVDRTYFNNVLIGGEGEFPPQMKSAWDMKRFYRIPSECVNFGGRNVIAVRVYDMLMGGGIYEGDVGVYSKLESLEPDMDLSGRWKFSTGDDFFQWALPEFDDNAWESIVVPSYWESMGHPEYNGFAWYRKSVVLPKRISESKLILLLGKIDEKDQTYFNGVLIGQTGRIQRDEGDWDWEKSSLEERAYFIPEHLIHRDKPNVISVRVLDTGGGGGIYEGPIGILTREHYLLYHNRRK